MSTKYALFKVLFFSIFALLNMILSIAEEQNSMELDVFNRLPILDGELYRCDDMAIVVNYLRERGKDEAVQLIREYNNKTHGLYNNELILVCRCLFVKPNGWEPVRFGKVVPPVNESVLKYFSHFPIAFSNGIPFLIIRGYRLHGRGEGLFQYLETCEKLPIRETEIPRANYQEAALKLIGTKNFHELFMNSEEEKDLADLILKQASLEKR